MEIIKNSNAIITRLTVALFLVFTLLILLPTPSLAAIPSTATTPNSAQLASILSSFQTILNQMRIILTNTTQAQTAGLVGYWTFDEGSGTTASDSSGSNNTGTLINGPTWTTGKIGQALNFDGVDDTVSASRLAAIDYSQPYAVSFWLKADAFGKIFISQVRTDTDRFAAGLLGGGTPRLNWGHYNGTSFNSVEENAASITALQMGTWYHFVLVNNADQSKLIYRNGVLNSTTSLSNQNAGASATNFLIGAATGAGQFFDGLIDDVRVYNRALSSQEATDLYNLGTTPPTLDATSPSVPSGLSASAISSSQINLSWTASTDNVGVAGYKVFRNGTQIAIVTGTSYQNTGLTANTSYSYTVSSYDAAGNNSAQSASVLATTQAGSDTTAPSVPTALSASAISSSQINLSWTASTDNVGVTGYRVYRGGVQIASVTTTSYSDTALTAATTYSYTVAAVDGAGNASAQSSAVSATTQALPPSAGGNAYYIDGTLISDCTSNNYSIANRNCSGADGNAYNTMQKGVNAASASVTLKIRGGIYNESVIIAKSGVFGSPITLVNYPNEVPILDGQNNRQYGLVTDNASWITVDGLTIRNFTIYGVFLSDQSNNDVIRNSVLHHNQVAIFLRGGDDTLIENNEVYSNHQTGIFVSWRDTNANYPLRSHVKYNLSYDNGVIDPESGDGIASDTSRDGIFENNISWNNRDDGMDISIGSVGNTIRNNIAFLNGYPATLCSDGTVCGDGNGIKVSTNGGGDHTIYRNISFGNRRSGFDQDIQLGVPRNYFYNNVAYGNGANGLTLDSGGRGDVGNAAVVKNNILAGNDRLNMGAPDYYACCTSPIQISDYNLISDIRMPAEEGANSLSGDPMLTNPNAPIQTTLSGGTFMDKWNYISNQVRANFTPKNGSKVINAGVVISNITDGYIGPAPDIGAYEYSGGTPPPSDTTSPSTPTNLSATAISSSQINLSWTASTDNMGVTGYRVYRGGVQIATVTTGTSYQNTGLSPSTTYSYTVAAYDAAGNVSAQSSSVSATTLAPLDVTPSILSAITSSSITQSSATITWTTDEPATTQVEYGLTASYGNSSTFNSTLTTSHSVSLSSLSSNSLYHYRVKSQDASSNLATSLDNTFTTSPAPDTTAPNAINNLSSSNIQSTSLTVSWSAPSDLPSGGSTASYDIRYSTSLLTSSNWNTSTQVSGEPAPASPGSSQSYIVAGLNPQTTYYVGIKSQDVAGNISLLSNVVTATTPPLPDTAPPVISSVTASSVSTSAATITWTTDELSDSQVEYGLTTSYGSSSPLNSSLATSHSITLSSLASGTLYHYRVKSKDASLNLASSGDFTFTTSVITPPPDITPPVISLVQATGITSSQATIIWTTDESSDSQIEYGLTASYGNATVIDSNMVTSHSTALTGLIRKTTYHYRVKSKDASGNLAVSGDNIFTTSARSPKPPKVTNLQASSGSVILSWTNPTDYEFFQGVVILKSTSGFFLSYDSSKLLANTQGLSVIDQSVTANTTYFYSVFTYDDLGVYSDPVNVSFTPLTPTPTTIGGSPQASSVPPSSGSSSGGGGSIIPTPVPSPSKVNIYGAKDQILLTWQNPSDSNFVRVKILRKEKNPSVSPTDGAVIYEGDGKEFTDTQNLKSNTTYYYTLFSLDRALATSSFYSASAKLGEKTNQEVGEAVLQAAKIEANLEVVKTNIASIQQSLLDYLNLIKASPQDLSLPAKLSEIQKAILAVIEDLRSLQEASTTKSQFTRAMFFGMRDSDVTALQQILIKEGLLASGKATGYFGPLTREAVKKFQIKYNIVSSGSEQTTGFGLVGKKTRERLRGR